MNDPSWIGPGSGDISDERFALPDGDGCTNKRPAMRGVNWI